MAHSQAFFSAREPMRQAANTTIAVTDQDLTAVSTGNTINAASVGSGAISLSDNALAGFGGVGNFLMNTGHNNSLQSKSCPWHIVAQQHQSHE